MKLPEFSLEELHNIQKDERSVEQHVIVPDKRRGAFLTVEEFERKWKIKQVENK